MTNFDDEYLKEFVLEAFELIEDAEQSLLSIEDSDEYQNHFDIIFRAFHSVKGGSSMVGLDMTEKIMHFLEDILTKADKNKVLTEELIDFFLSGLDDVKKTLNGEEVNFSFQSPFDKKQEDNVTSLNKKEIIKKTEKEYLARIYHVDDEPEISEALKDILEDSGYHVTSFISGEEMLKVLKPKSTDIIISDYNMPGLSGIEVILESKKIDPDVPVLLLSGFLSQEICIDAINKGAFAMLEKPFNTQLMFSLLINATKRVRYSRLVNRTMKLLMYQFSDLEEFLKENGKEHIRDTIKSELELLITERNSLR